MVTSAELGITTTASREGAMQVSRTLFQCEHIQTSGCTNSGRKRHMDAVGKVSCDLEPSSPVRAASVRHKHDPGRGPQASTGSDVATD